MMRSWMTALAAICLASCQSVHSQYVDFASAAPVDGLQYAAPKALMKVELVAENGALTLGISQPFLVGDPEATFALSTSSSIFANNQYFFVVNPQTRLLTYVNSVTEGKAGAILAALARSAGSLSGLKKNSDEAAAFATNFTGTVFSTVIDPFQYEGCDFATACKLTALNQKLWERGWLFLGCDDPKSRAVNGDCEALNANRDYFNITLDPLFKVTRSAGPVRQASSCSSSICYRAPAPYLIGVHVGRLTDESRVIMMPNESPILSLSLPAGVFATAKARVDLVHGMPATVGITQDSELLGIAIIPLTVIKEFFAGVSDVFSFRVNYDTSTVNLIKADTARRAAEDSYDEAKAARAAARLAKAKATLTTAETGSPTMTEQQKTDAIAAAKLEVDDAQKEQDAMDAARKAAESGAAADATTLVTGTGGSDEAATLKTYLEAIPDDKADADNAKKLQDALVTVIDEGTTTMFTLKVLRTAAAGTAAPPAPATQGPQALQGGPGAPTTPTVDPDAANKAH